MNKAILSNRIYLSETPQLLEILKSNLTYEFAQFGPAPNLVYYDVIQVTDSIVSIPSARLDLIPDDYEIIDKRVKVPITFPKSNFTLREDQKELVNSVEDSCIVNAQPGWGKTYTALAIIEKFKQKTLIIVHSVALRDQWCEEIKKVFGFDADIIGSSKFGLTSPIVVSNVQTLKKYSLKLIKEFGMVIVDECHKTPANSFKNILDTLKARYKMGLSATLHRKDGKHVMIKDYISQNIYKTKDNNKMTPKIAIYETDIKLRAGLNIPWADSINELTSNDAYKLMIITLSKLYRDAGYSVLVLSDRVEFLNICSSHVSGALAITSETEDREEMLELIKDGTINPTFGSISIFKEGINIPPWSCVILATPIGHNAPMLEQIIGRITRPFGGKKQPVVVDFRLSGNTAYRQLQSRIGYYIQSNYLIENIIWEN